MKHRRIPRDPFVLLCLVLILLSSVIACSREGDTYPAPPQTDDGWETAGPAAVGIDARRLDDLVDRIRDDTYKNVHSVLIVKDGKLVFEEYFGGHDFDYYGDQFHGAYVEHGIDTLHNQASVTKAVTSALIGLAIDHGFIAGVDEKLFKYFPEYAHLGNDAKGEIALLHLLTMTSGFEWNETEVFYDDTRNDLIQLFIVPDPIAYILSKPLLAEPGTRWYYSGGDVNLLGEIIRRATGLRMDNFAREFLFEPLGITAYEWDFIKPDFIHASGNLKLRPRDMAKIGALYLNGGVWQGQRIISQEWVEASTREFVRIPRGGALSGHADAYGYQWFLKTYHSEATSINAFFRSGWGGQKIIVFPSLDMVVVFTGGNYAEPEPVDEIVTRYILPAVHVGQ
jgi:CubicO group peptidase (beta-lactamase class C family)